MNAKRVVLFCSVALAGIAVVLIAVVAAGVGGEASDLNGFLKDAVSTHQPIDQVRQKLTSTGYRLDAGAPTSRLTGTGPHHSAIVYSTWLTVNVDFNQDQKTTGFQIERASGWF
jgi:hypothetical protein